MNVDDPVDVQTSSISIGLGTIAGFSDNGKVRVLMDGAEQFHIEAPARWFSKTPFGGYILTLP